VDARVAEVVGLEDEAGLLEEELELLDVAHGRGVEDAAGVDVVPAAGVFSCSARPKQERYTNI
jgi:hypothetical protein